MKYGPRNVLMIRNHAVPIRVFLDESQTCSICINTVAIPVHMILDENIDVSV